MPPILPTLASRNSDTDIGAPQGYERKSGALNAIRIAQQSHGAPVKDITQRVA